VAFTAPVPRLPHRFWLRETTAGRRSHVILSLGRSSTRCPSGYRLSPTHQRSIRRRRMRGSDTFAPRHLGLRHLGPRSLSPPPFLERCVRAYLGPGSCLPTSATNTTYGHQPELSFPRRDGGHDLLPFLTRHARPSCEAVTRGEPRIRPFVPTPVPVPPACAGLPDRDTEPTAPPPTTCAGELSGD